MDCYNGEKGNWRRESGQKVGMYKQEMGINLYVNAVLLHRRKKIETKS